MVYFGNFSGDGQVDRSAVPRQRKIYQPLGGTIRHFHEKHAQINLSAYNARKIFSMALYCDKTAAQPDSLQLILPSTAIFKRKPSILAVSPHSGKRALTIGITPLVRALISLLFGP